MVDPGSPRPPAPAPVAPPAPAAPAAPAAGGPEGELPAGERSPAGLVEALERAAELEHAVLLQYLFAAASLKRRPDEGVTILELERIRGWERTLLAIAREEMAHLAAVSNLLIVVGAAPWLVRPGLPGGRLPAPSPTMVGGRSQAGEVLVLERFGAGSLARFVALERDEAGEDTIAGHYTAIKSEIGRLEVAGGQLIRATPVDRVDGWGISGAARFGKVSDAAGALAVIDAIVGQGAGGADDSHLARLEAVEAELAGAGFDPARRVVTNPVIGAGPGTRVSDGFTLAVAAAFAAAYQSMLLLLELHYALLQAGSRGAFVARRAVQGMMSGVLRPLGEVLAELPVGEAAPGWSCGPTFGWDMAVGLSPDRVASWSSIELMMAAAGGSLVRLAGEGDLPRLAFVGGNLRLAARLVARGAAEDA